MHLKSLDIYAQVFVAAKGVQVSRRDTVPDLRQVCEFSLVSILSSRFADLNHLRAWSQIMLALFLSLLCQVTQAATQPHYLQLRIIDDEGFTAQKAFERLTALTDVSYRIRFANGALTQWALIDRDALPEAKTIFEITPGVVHRLEIHTFSGDGILLKKSSALAGRDVPIENWTIGGMYYAIDVQDDAEGPRYYLMRIEMKNRVALWVRSFSTSEFDESRQERGRIFFMMAGAVSMLILQSLVLWRTSAESGYGWLALCLASLLTLETSAQGYWHYYIGGALPWLSIRVVSISSSVFLLSYIQFSFAVIRSQFRSKDHVVKWSGVLSIVALILLMMVLFGDFGAAVALLSSYAFVVSVLLAILTVGSFGGVNRSNAGILLVHISFIALWTVRMADLFGVDILGAVSFPRLAEYQYMYIWIACGTAVYFFITRNTSSVLKNHLRWQQGMIRRMDAAVKDRTQELIDAQQEALRVSAVQRDFLGIMSHELRTPLSAVVALGKMIAGRQDTTRLSRVDAESIQRLSKQTLTMVDAAIAFVRDGKIDENENRSTVDMVSLKRDLVAIGKWLSSNQGNQFSMEFDVDSARLIFDDLKLRQIIINLLTNAGRYCKDGAIKLSVRQPKGSLFMFVEVADTGRGMSAQDLELYMKPYERSESSEGLGLGLHICRKLASIIQAKLSVTSIPNEGTLVSLRVPVDQDVHRQDFADSDVNNFVSSASVNLQTRGSAHSEIKARVLLLSTMDAAAQGRLSDIEVNLKLLREKHGSVVSTAVLQSADEFLEMLDLEGLAQLLKKELDK